MNRSRVGSGEEIQRSRKALTIISNQTGVMSTQNSAKAIEIKINVITESPKPTITKIEEVQIEESLGNSLVLNNPIQNIIVDDVAVFNDENDVGRFYHNCISMIIIILKNPHLKIIIIFIIMTTFLIRPSTCSL